MHLNDFAILAIATLSAILLFSKVLQFGPIRERARTKAIVELADDIGFAPNLPPPAGGLFGPQRGEFALFHRSPIQQVSVLNLLTGQGSHQGTYLFDYQVGIGFGHYYNTWEMTIASIDLGDRRIPDFSIRPTHGKLRKVDPFADTGEIELNNYPEFSQFYILEGANASAVRAVLTDNVIRHLERDGTLWLECRAGWLVYYRTNVRVAPEHLGRFADEAEWVLDEMDRGRRI